MYAAAESHVQPEKGKGGGREVVTAVASLRKKPPRIDQLNLLALDAKHTNLRAWYSSYVLQRGMHVCS